MTAPEPTPTAEHIDALRQAISDPNATTPRREGEHLIDWQLRAILAQPDALLDALVRAGVLTEETAKRVNLGSPVSTYSERRLVTQWEGSGI